MNFPAGTQRISPAHTGLWLIGLMWLLPFLQPHHRAPIPSFYTEWLAFALGLAASTLLLRTACWRAVEIPRTTLFLLALIGLLLVQLAAGQLAYNQQAFLAALYLLWAVLLMWLGHALRRELGLEAMALTLARFVVAGGIISALIALAQYFQVHSALDPLLDMKIGGGAYGNLGQTNHFADYLALALASLLYLHAKGNLPRWLAVAASLLLLFALALSGSRSSWLYLLALSGLALWLRRRVENTNVLLVSTALLLPGFMLVQYVAHLPWLATLAPVTTATDRLFQFAQGVNPRLQLAQEAWRIFVEHPWLGAGFGQFSWHHFLFAAASPDSSPRGLYNHAHNILLQLLAEFGVGGGLLLIGGALVWLRACRKIFASLESWWLLALLAVIGIHSMLEYPLWYANFLGIAAFLLGAGEARVIQPKLARIGRLSLLLMLMLGWVSAFNLQRSYASMENIFADHAQLAAGQTLDQALAEIHRESLLTPYIEFAYSTGIILDGYHLADKIELNGKVMRFAPVSDVAYRQAALLALNGERETAAQQWNRAANAYPAELGDFVKTLQEVQPSVRPAVQPLIDLSQAKLKEQMK